MRPLHSTTAWPALAVYDLEAAHWVNIELVCHIDEYGNRVSFPNTSEYLDWLFSPAFAGDTVFAHAGGRYDHRFLLEHIKAKGWNFRANLSGGTIVILTVNNGSRTIKFGDSYRLMPDSLEKIGKTVGLHKLEVNPSLIHEMSAAETLAYCFRDCEVALKGLQLMRDTLTTAGADFAFTLASIASRYIRRSPLDWHKFTVRKLGKWRPRPDFLIWDKECYKSYYGGRCEMFRQGIITGKLYWYDIVSSYPASMRGVLPLYYKGYFVPPVNMRSLSKYLSHVGITDCTVNVPKGEYITCLPVKGEGDRLSFPTGLVSGSWTNIELKRALELGYEFVDVRGQHRFEGETWLSGYVDKFYQLRQAAKNAKDEFGSYAYKILLNSSYGKTVETVDRVSYMTGGEVLAAQEEGARIEATPTQGVFAAMMEELGPFRHSAAGSYITAYSRLRLFDMAHAMHKKGAKLIYCDTDSLMLDMPIENTGNKLGDWELVDILSEVEVILPKVYRAVSATGKKTVYKCKGCPIERKWETDEKPDMRWQAFKKAKPTQAEIDILGKDGITGFLTDIREGRLTPKRIEGPCRTCRKTGKYEGMECPTCNGTGKVHKPLVRSLQSQDKKRQWTGQDSIPIHFEKRT